MGRSRGGLTTKIHALVDGEGRPIRLALSEGQSHDSLAAEPLLQDLTEGTIVLADRAYDTDAIRAHIEARKAWANIPPKRNRTKSFPFSTWLYRKRNLVERFFNRLKNCRRIATRYDKRQDNYIAGIKLIALRIWMQSYESTA